MASNLLRSEGASGDDSSRNWLPSTRRPISRQARVSGTAIPETPRSGLEDPSQYVLWRATKQMAQSLRVASPSGHLTSGALTHSGLIHGTQRSFRDTAL